MNVQLWPLEFGEAMVYVRTTGWSVSAALLLALLAGGCTGTTSPPATPTPTVVQTPSETEQERQQREAYAAAETAYRTFRAEYGRVLRAGGAKEATAVMKETAGGPYLASFVEVIQASKGLGDRDTGEEKLVYVRRAGYTETSLLLDVCEDSRQVKTFDKTGKEISQGEIRTAQIEVQKHDSAWKLWSGQGKKVDQCD